MIQLTKDGVVIAVINSNSFTALSAAQSLRYSLGQGSYTLTIDGAVVDGPEDVDTF